VCRSLIASSCSCSSISAVPALPLTCGSATDDGSKDKITYIPAHNHIQQYQLRKPKPPSLVHFEMCMAVALALAIPRSSSCTCLLFICSLRKDARFTRPHLHNPLVVHARRILQHPIIALCVCDFVHRCIRCRANSVASGSTGKVRNQRESDIHQNR
jgi:hypothetical protein